MIIDWNSGNIYHQGNSYYSGGNPMMLSWSGSTAVSVAEPTGVDVIGGEDGIFKRPRKDEDELILLVAKAFIEAIN